MWIVIGIIYLFIGLVLGSVMCLIAGDDPTDNDSMLAIVAIGIFWPVVLVLTVLYFFYRFATNVAAALIKQCDNDTQEEEESHG